MRKLPLKNESYQYLLMSFKDWLDTLGYSQQTVYNLPNHIRELFHYMEQNNIDHIKELDNEIIEQYYKGLKTRSNERLGGGLSNAYLNKHLQALYKFTKYLRQSGRMILPMLTIDWESNDVAEMETLTVAEIQQLYKVTYGYQENTKWECLNARDRAILTVFYGCGLRKRGLLFKSI